MNEPREPVERELSALRPVEVSPDLRRRVAEGLAAPPPPPSRLRWMVPLAIGLAAACLLLVTLPWRGGGSGRIVTPPRPAPPVAAEVSAPMLLAYQRALARSPEELVALLDKQATARPGPVPRVARTLNFRGSASALDTFLGDE